MPVANVPAVERCGRKGQGCQRPQTAEADPLLHEAAQELPRKNAAFVPAWRGTDATRFCPALTLYRREIARVTCEELCLHACICWVCTQASVLTADDDDDDVSSASGLRGK